MASKKWEEIKKFRQNCFKKIMALAKENGYVLWVKTKDDGKEVSSYPVGKCPVCDKDLIRKDRTKKRNPMMLATMFKETPSKYVLLDVCMNRWQPDNNHKCTHTFKIEFPKDLDIPSYGNRNAHTIHKLYPDKVVVLK